jgi:hypothetical protein
MDLRVALPDHQQRAQCQNSVRQHTMPRKSLKASTHATKKYSLRGTRFPAVRVLHRLQDMARPKALKLDICSHFTHNSYIFPSISQLCRASDISEKKKFVALPNVKSLLPIVFVFTANVLVSQLVIGGFIENIRRQTGSALYTEFHYTEFHRDENHGRQWKARRRRSGISRNKERRRRQYQMHHVRSSLLRRQARNVELVKKRERRKARFACGGLANWRREEAST